MSEWIYKLLRRHLSDEEISTFTSKQLKTYIADCIIEEHFGFYPYDEDDSPGCDIALAIQEIDIFLQQKVI